PEQMSIGAKRNLACQSARGEIVAHWDDDDWYAPERLARQVQPLLGGEADLSGLESSCVLELAAARFWAPSARLHERMFVGNVHGGTLVFRKAIFDSGGRYPNLNLAEDAAFLRSATRHGHRLARVANAGLFVYVRHGANAWPFLAGQFLDSSGWREAQGPPDFLPKLSEYQDCLNVVV
ncbi:MAG TPA: glycosyltransferase family A protein, partial [Verrucomicrobiae bacterium]